MILIQVSDELDGGEYISFSERETISPGFASSIADSNSLLFVGDNIIGGTHLSEPGLENKPSSQGWHVSDPTFEVKVFDEHVLHGEVSSVSLNIPFLHGSQPLSASLGCNPLPQEVQ